MSKNNISKRKKYLVIGTASATVLVAGGAAGVAIAVTQKKGSDKQVGTKISSSAAIDQNQVKKILADKIFELDEFKTFIQSQLPSEFSVLNDAEQFKHFVSEQVAKFIDTKPQEINVVYEGKPIAYKVASIEDVSFELILDAKKTPRTDIAFDAFNLFGTKEHHFQIDVTTVANPSQILQTKLNEKFLAHHDDAEILSFVNYDKNNPLASIAASNLTTTQLQVEGKDVALSFEGYNGPTGDENSGEMTLIASYQDQQEIRTIPFVVNLPFNKTVNQYNTDKLSPTLTFGDVTPIATINGIDVKELTETTDVATKETLLLSMLQSLGNHDFSQTSLTNITVTNYSDTTKSFVITFGAALGKATPKTITMNLTVSLSQHDATTDPNIGELDDFVRQNVSHLTINANLDRPDLAIVRSNIIWSDLNQNFAINDATFSYTAPQNDATRGVVTFTITHNTATKSITKEVNFNLSVNQYKTNALSNIVSGDATTPSAITIDNVVALDMATSAKITNFKAMLSAIGNTSLTGAVITDVNVNTYSVNDKRFVISFKAAFGSANPKDLTLTVTTTESKSQLIARKAEAELTEWVRSHSSMIALKTSVDLSNPLTNIDKSSFATAPFDDSHVLVSMAYAAPAHDERVGRATLKIGTDDLGDISTTYVFNVNFTQSVDEMELNHFAENVTLGSAAHHTRFINVDELKAGYADHEKLLTLIKIALPAVQTCSDIDAVDWGANGHPIDTRLWNISNARFVNEPAFSESASFHTVQVDATSVTGQHKVMTIKIYQRLGLHRLYVDYISPQSHVLSKNDVPLDPNETDIQAIVGWLSKFTLTKDGMVAADSLKRYMNTFAAEGWGIQGDNMVDGFNAIRFAVWRDANGDPIGKMLLDGFIKGSFPDIREGMEARRKQAIRDMFAAQGYPEMQDATITNLKFEGKAVTDETPNPYTDETKAMRISFDAKIDSWPVAKSFDWTINLADDLTEKAIGTDGTTPYQLWGTTFNNRLAYLNGIFDSYQGKVEFKQAELDKLLTPAEVSDQSQHFSMTSAVWMNIGGRDYGWNGINFLDKASYINYDLDSTSVTAKIRLNYQGARRSESLTGSLSATPNYHLTSLIKDAANAQAITISGEYAAAIKHMTEKQKIQLLVDLYGKEFGDSTLASAKITDINVALDDATKVGTITYKENYGLARAVSHTFKFTFAAPADQSTDAAKKLTIATNAYVALDDTSFQPKNLQAFTDKVYTTSSVFAPTDFNNEFTGSTISNIRVTPPRYSISRDASVSFDVTKDGFTAHRSMKVTLAASKAEHVTNNMNIPATLNMTGHDAHITGSDFKVIRQNFKESTFYDFMAKQVNDWLESKAKLFITSNGFDGGDYSWAHAPHDDLKFIEKDAQGNYKYQFKPDNAEMDWKNMKPFRLDYIASLFAQERSQMIDHLCGFDMHNWGATIHAFTDPTVADVSGIKRQDWGRFAAKPMFPARSATDLTPHSPAGDAAGNNDNYLVTYDSRIDRVANPNKAGVDFYEGLAAGVWNLYDATDGSRSGGHRTAMLMANNDRMGWSPGKSGQVYMDMVQYGRFEEDKEIYLYQNDLKNAANPRQAILDVRAKYPWSNSASGIFKGMGFDVYIAHNEIGKFFNDVLFKLIEANGSSTQNIFFNRIMWRVIRNQKPGDNHGPTAYNLAEPAGFDHFVDDDPNTGIRSKFVAAIDSLYSSSATNGGVFATPEAFGTSISQLIAKVIEILGVQNDINESTRIMNGGINAQHEIIVDTLMGRIDHVTQFNEQKYRSSYLKAMAGMPFDVSGQSGSDSHPYDLNGGSSVFMARSGSSEYPEDLYAVLEGE